MTEKTESCPSCGNRYDGDNLCAPWACQWEGTEEEGKHAPASTAITPAALAELRAVRQRYVETQASRQLDQREGDMSRAQIDDAEIAAKMRWDEQHPALAMLIRLGIAASSSPLVHAPDASPAGVRLSDGEDTSRG